MERKENQVITGEVRFSYAHVWEPVAINDGDKKYSVSILIPKSDTKTIKAINNAIEAAKQAGISKFGGKIPANLKMPLRDGDIDREDDGNYADCYFINANCKTAPGIVNKSKQPIIDTTEFYSGCYGHADISLYAFNTNGNKGIACGLNNLMKTRDGEPLGGKSRAEDAFAELYKDDEDDFLG